MRFSYFFCFTPCLGWAACKASYASSSSRTEIAEKSCILCKSALHLIRQKLRSIRATCACILVHSANHPVNTLWDHKTHRLVFRSRRCHHIAHTGFRSSQWTELQPEESACGNRPPAMRADVQCQRNTFQIPGTVKMVEKVWKFPLHPNSPKCLFFSKFDPFNSVRIHRQATK